MCSFNHISLLVATAMHRAKYLLYCLVVTSFSYVNCRTIYVELNTPSAEEIQFLKRYGYLSDQGDGLPTYTDMVIGEALEKMQAFAGLPQTGTMDAETKRLFKRKRCGVKDIIDDASPRKRRYVTYTGWNKKSITYNVLNGSSTLSKERVERQLEAGLAIWAPHGGLTFTKTDDNSTDIKVSFGKKDHGDGYPFDGPGHVMAHAFPPPLGNMHFDDDELWSDSPEEDQESELDVTDFLAVAVHEIGHALGLCHSSVKESIMYPYYKAPVENLHSDDILGLRELYMKDEEASEEPEPEPPEVTESSVASHSSQVPKFTRADDQDDENEIPDLCYANYDTIQVIKGKIFIFEEEWVWVLREKKEIEDGYPKRFHEVFHGLPANVTYIKTVYEKRNGNIAVFTGRVFYEFDPDFNFIRRGLITEYLIPSQIAELSTVFVSNYNNKTYLIEYERFWRYDEDLGAMDRGYPKDMSAWRQLPYPVDAAIIWKEDTYFFRGPRFWRFDNDLVAAHDYYPLPTAQIWFPCAADNDMRQYVVNDVP